MSDVKIKKKVLKKKVYEAGKKVKKEYKEVELPLYPKKMAKGKSKPSSTTTGQSNGNK